MTNVEPEEAQAILDATQPDEGAATHVEPRNFAEPLRLSPDELEGVRQRVKSALSDVVDGLAVALRTAHGVELMEVVETSSNGVFDGVESPTVILCFEVGGQPAWLIWSLPAALQAVEVALGSEDPGEPQERALTTVERRVLARMLQSVAGGIAAALGVEGENWRIVEDAEEAGSWTDGGETADPQRLRVGLRFEGPGAESVFRVYLPGIRPLARVRAAEPEGLPKHLTNVSFGLSARLGSVDVPLDELLQVEVGDVIPLSEPVDRPLQVEVDGKPWALGRLGRRNGTLAIEILGRDDRDDE